MFSPALEKQRQQLYARTVREMGKRLAADDTPETIFAALGWGMDTLERTYTETPASVRAKVACHAGCGHCCHVSIDVQAHEVFYVAHHIQLHFSPVALAEVIARAAHRRAQVAALSSPSDRDHFMHPCALLRDGHCTAYAARPEACRVHHTSDASRCAAHIADPTLDLESTYIPPLRARLFAVMLGLDEALETAGYDDRAYDLGSALHEALTNSLCLARWLQHHPAFPTSCLAST